MSDHIGTATYSPEDNKIRISAFSRLSPELYARVKAAGFSWAPRQEIFVAPMWTPGREDLALELCGEIGDEDTSLIDRAEDRAERFEGYKESRIEDANRAHAAVDRICEHIPLGQPILIGHHSERHARKDAQRIESGMRAAVNAWRTAEYWQQRAAGAIRHAKYKENPGVRYRRIKGLEADKRKRERQIAESERFMRLWANDAASVKAKDGSELTFLERARRLSGVDNVSKCFTLDEFPRPEGASTYEGMMSLYSALGDEDRPGFITPEQARDIANRVHERSIAHARRWLEHYENRIAYEKAMLDEKGNIAAAKFSFEVGGKVLLGDEWLVILKINKTGEQISSLTTTPRRHYWGTSYKADIEIVKDYRAPAPEETAAVKAATKLPPMCNYPGEGFAHMTTADYAKVYTDHKRGQVVQATETHGKHRRRNVDNFVARKFGAALGSQWGDTPVFLTDAKRVDPPAIKPALPDVPTPREILEGMAADLKAENPAPRSYTPLPSDPRIPANLYEMERQAKQGVTVVVAPQLFPTPPELAARMVDEAGISAGARVLEPSAGTGNIIDAIHERNIENGNQSDIVAVEISQTLAHRLAFNSALSPDRVVTGDFLEQNGNLGKFDRILMNPPFANGADIQHIKHAVKFLKPGGRLVAICDGGPRQHDQLKPLAENSGGIWEPLPAGTFKDQGTNVNTVLLTIEA